MTNYMLCISVDGVTINPDQIYDTEKMCYIPRGSYLWKEYEEWLGEGNIPDTHRPTAGQGSTLSGLAELKRMELREACSDEITRSSFQSASLGAIHNYDSRVVDQLNLKVRFDIATMTAAPEPLWASDGTRYQWKLHTAAQLLTVMVDMNAHVKEAQINLASKLAAVDAATTSAQIAIIQW